ncbi:hypothetical protein [Aquimarina algiphila]|uniref:hypothetical protein n=1 Tax=Aquimarina algiphila TaxID=2047982 RepID=UPI00232D9373|nr:hypothetical protein [Aquimarina algiphila]
MKYLMLLFIFILISCKPKATGKRTDFNETQNPTNENELVKYRFNITMEWATRIDEFVVVENTITGHIQRKVEEIDDDFTVIKLQKKKYLESSLTTLIKNNRQRIEKKKNARELLKIIKTDDTISLYSYGLSDKSKFIKEYFAVMKTIYPNNHSFEYPKIIID